MTDNQRLFSLDALRGYAILNMIVIHFVVYWSAPVQGDIWLHVVLNHLTGADCGAAGFLMLAGMGLALSQAARPQPAVHLVRGVGLFVIGLLMILVAWGPGQLWRWDILTLMGAAVLASLGLRPLPSWLLLLICLAAAGITPWLREGIDFARHWGGEMQPVPGMNDLWPGILWDPPGGYVSRHDLVHILQGFLLAGEFPLLPWIVHPILGMVLGRLLLAGRLGPAAPRLALTGLGLALALTMGRHGGRSPLTGYLAPLSFYPASFTMMLMQAGVAVAVIVLLYYFLDYRRQRAQRAGLVGRCLVRAGRASLSLYFIHYLLVAWPLRLGSWMAGRSLEDDFTPAGWPWPWAWRWCCSCNPCWPAGPQASTATDWNGA